MKIELKRLALAMAQQEGWFDPVNVEKPLIPHRCNNPGNLRWAHERFLQAQILVGGKKVPALDHGYCVFLSKDWGGNALLNDLRAKLLKGWTLRYAIDTYCPVGDGANDPLVYVRNVAGWVNADPEQKMSDLFQDPGYISGEWKDFPALGSGRPFTGKH